MQTYAKDALSPSLLGAISWKRQTENWSKINQCSSRLMPKEGDANSRMMYPVSFVLTKTKGHLSTGLGAAALLRFFCIRHLIGGSRVVLARTHQGSEWRNWIRFECCLTELKIEAKRVQIFQMLQIHGRGECAWLYFYFTASFSLVYLSRYTKVGMG